MTEAETHFYRFVGNAVRNRREALGLTQDELAGLIAVSRPSLINIEKGRQRVYTHHIAGLARHLRVPIGNLLPDLSGDEHGVEQMLEGHRPEVVTWVTDALQPEREEQQ